MGVLGGRRVWLGNDEKQRIMTLYGTMPTATLAKIVGRPVSTLLTWAYRWGINQRSTRKHFWDEHYFDIIDTAEKAYWLGFIFADGSIQRESRKGLGNTPHAVIIEIHKQDADHLKKFQAVLGHTGLLHYRRNTVKLALYSKHFASAITFLRPKEIVKPWERIDASLHFAFIRGVLDGDGTIYRPKNPPGKSRIEIYGSVHLCNFIQKLCGFGTVYVKGPSSWFHGVRLGSVDRLKYLIIDLYGDGASCLQRKFETLQRNRLIPVIAGGALPNQINSTVPSGSDLPSVIDNRIRSLALAVEDILGIPDQTNISTAACAVTTSGMTRVVFADAAANPATAGHLQRNSTNLLFHDGTAARTLVNSTNTVTLTNKTLETPNIDGAVDIDPDARSGTPSTAGAWIDVSGNTFTDNNTAGSGTAASFAAHAIARPTLAASESNVTTTDATTLYVQNAPAAGSNQSLTNAWAVWIDDGRARFDGQLAGAGVPIVNEYRISTTSGAAVVTSDVTNATTIYVTPYVGNHISLYDGTIWQVYAPGEMSLAVPATANVNFDLFCQPVSGTPTLVAVTWSNDTLRITGLAKQDNVYVLSGTPSRRYLGTFRCGPSSGQVFNSAARRHVWNYYHRMDLHMVTYESVDSWTYSTAAFRQALASAANQLDFVIGVSEDAVSATVQAHSSSSGGSQSRGVGVGVDSTTTSSAQQMGLTGDGASTDVAMYTASYCGFVSAGRHLLVWLEYAAATATATWQGDNGAPTTTQSGIRGRLRG